MPFWLRDKPILIGQPDFYPGVIRDAPAAGHGNG